MNVTKKFTGLEENIHLVVSVPEFVPGRHNIEIKEGSHDTRMRMV